MTRTNGSSWFLAAIAALALGPTARAQDPSPQLTWTLADHQQGLGEWGAAHLALGNNATAVFALRDLTEPGSMLLSRHDASPPAPVWSTLDAIQVRPLAADAAALADVYASVTSEFDSGVGHVVRVSVARTAGPAWTWTHPSTPAATVEAGVAVSRGGGTIVAVLRDADAGMLHGAVFGPLSAVPVQEWSMAGDASLELALSPDGGRLALRAGTALSVLAMPSAAPLWSTTTTGSPAVDPGLDLDLDGTLLVYNDDDVLQFRRWDGAAYAAEFTQGVALDRLVGLALSSDGSTCAFATYGSGPLVSIVAAECLDVPSRTLTMLEVPSSDDDGWLADMAIAEDGSVFALGVHSDEMVPTGSLRIYRPDVQEAVMLLDLVSLPNDVDVSPDGRWVACAATAVYGVAARIDLVSMGGDGLVLQGAPAKGAPVTLQLAGQPGQFAALLASTAVADPPVALKYGDLHLQLAGLAVYPVGVIGAGGTLSLRVLLPDQPAYVGVTLALQGMTAPPKGLTNAWIPLTILP